VALAGQLQSAVAVVGRFWLRSESMADQLSTLYGDLLQDSYDCVDRVILNAYFTMGQSGGGLRTWWRALYGSDDNLDNHMSREMFGCNGMLALPGRTVYHGDLIISCAWRADSAGAPACVSLRGRRNRSRLLAPGIHPDRKT
jgi:hypothetical protein